MANQIRRRKIYINKPDRTKPIRRTYKPKSRTQSDQTKKPCFARLHELKIRLPCPTPNEKCKASYANQTTLERHIKNHHQVQPVKQG